MYDTYQFYVRHDIKTHFCSTICGFSLYIFMVLMEFHYSATSCWYCFGVILMMIMTIEMGCDCGMMEVNEATPRKTLGNLGFVHHKSTLPPPVFEPRYEVILSHCSASRAGQSNKKWNVLILFLKVHSK